MERECGGRRMVWVEETNGVERGSERKPRKGNCEAWGRSRRGRGWKGRITQLSHMTHDVLLWFSASVRSIGEMVLVLCTRHPTSSSLSSQLQSCHLLTLLSEPSQSNMWVCNGIPLVLVGALWVVVLWASRYIQVEWIHHVCNDRMAVLTFLAAFLLLKIC